MILYPPWQVVLLFLGAAITRLRSIEELPPSYLLSFVLKSGRAVALASSRARAASS